MPAHRWVVFALVGLCLEVTPVSASIAVSPYHAVIAKPDGTVWTWGRNYSGQLGDGTTDSKTLPTQVSLTGVTDVAVGEAHSLALKSDGTVWAWGANWYGQLGNGTQTSETTPIQVPGLTGIVDIAAGTSHSLAVKSDGTVWAWGANWWGQLGNNSTTNSSSPVQVVGLTNVTAIAAGGNHSLARSMAGEVRAWGGNWRGQLGNGNTDMQATPVTLGGISDVVAVTAGGVFSAAVKSDGTVWTWGDNGSGQLGSGTSGGYSSLPTQVASVTNVAAIGSGTSHVLARVASGESYAWGANYAGQLGDGSTNARPSPAIVAGLTNVQAVAAGGATSLALTTAGELWSWGDNGDGQLGDGTTVRAASPISISGPGLIWRVGAPTFDPNAGTYEPDFSVNVSTATAGATIHYTIDGSEPTESSPVSSGTIMVNSAVTVRARAFKADTPPSRVVVVDYVLQTAAPTFTPEGGTYGAPMTAAIRTRTVNATIRFTTDGAEPTELSSIYSSPIPIDVTTTVRAKAYRAGTLPSDTSNATFILKVARPSASPAPGSYSSLQTITLSAVAGATIRYTVDGSTPTEASTLYAGPIAMSASPLTVHAKAFKPGWEPSDTLVATYEVGTDTTDPTIEAKVRPLPNAAGWNRTPVTVTFECRDDFAEPLQQCSAPVMVTTEGANQVVTGTVVDGAGHSASVSVTLNLDLTPAAAVMTAPTAGQDVSTSTIALTGTATDPLSGVASVRCSGQPASVSGGSVSCTVPLAKGRNTIVLQVTDVAGNSTSTSVDVFRTGPATSIRVVPSSFSLAPGQNRTLQVIDDFGRSVDTVTWDVSDADVAEFDTEQPMRVKASSPGTVTLTATSGTLSGTATLEVVAAAGVGTVVWAVPTQLGSGSVGRTVYPQNGEANDPDLYLVEHAGGMLTLRGMKADGREVSVHSLAAEDEPSEPVGDARGGAVVHLTSDSIARVGPGGSWTYRSAGELRGLLVDNDNAVYVVETEDQGSHSSDPVYRVRTSALLKLDGTTGQVVSRTGFPRLLRHNTNWDNCHYYIDDSASASAPSLDGDGNVRVMLEHGATWNFEGYWESCGQSYGTNTVTLSMLTLKPDGTSVVQDLKQSTSQWPGGSESFWPGLIVPDEGGVVAYDTSGSYSGSENLDPPTTALRFTATGSTTLNLPTSASTDLVVGRGETAYLASPERITAFNVTTGTQVWQSTIGGQIVNVLGNGGVAVWQEAEEGPGTLVLLDGTGAISSAQLLPILAPRYWSVGNWHGTGTGSFAVVRGAWLEDATFTTALQRTKPRTPRMSHFYPIDLGSGVTAEAARDVIRQAVPRARINHTFYLRNGHATVRNFTNAIKNADIDAVAYIGHSVLRDDTHTSYGMWFATEAEVGFEETLLKIPNPPPAFLSGPGVPTWVDRLETQIKIAFIGSCSLSDDFKSLWDIAPTTNGRVLVTSPTPDTRLNIANLAWSYMIKALDDGCTASEAIAYANNQIANLSAGGQILPRSDGIVEYWESTGDASIRLRAQRKGVCVQ